MNDDYDDIGPSYSDLSDDYTPRYEEPPLPLSEIDEVPGESPLLIGSDGDDIGQQTKVKFRVDGNGDPERQLALFVPYDMLASAHGYLIQDLGDRPKTMPRDECELCGSPIIAKADEWLCELGVREDQCECNWCLLRGQWMRGEYRPSGGRPAKRCGTEDCKRRAARERKRRQRERERADREGVTETPL
ncbi:MAG: hypothetical protein JST91_08600 [Actinobacteria bacterium]|nr:hypothetical protein [Actinomycetota bacterium]